jgi:hypothetical protein
LLVNLLGCGQGPQVVVLLSVVTTAEDKEKNEQEKKLKVEN